MLENTDYSIVGDFNSCGLIKLKITNEDNSKSGEVFVFSGEGSLNKVELFDGLVREGILGKLDFDGFVEEISLDLSMDDLLDMYNRCVDIDGVLGELFGDYASVWESDIDLISK